MTHGTYFLNSTLAALLLTGVAYGSEERPASQPEAARSQDVAPVGEELIAEGRKVFTGRGICATCHGQDATGTPLAPDLTDDEWLNLSPPVTPDEIEELIREGVPQPRQHPAPMPPMGGASLTENEIRAAAAYVFALGH